MKRLHTIIIAASLTSLMFTSCKKVVMKDDLGNFNTDQVFNDSTVAKLYVDYIYTQNQPSWFGNSGGYIGSGNGLTDESYSDNPQVKGTVTMNDVGDIGSSVTVTSTPYVKIRSLNTFIQNINAGTLETPVKKRFAAQAIFWRAYRYFELVKLYGGVPLVTVPLNAVGADAKAAANLPRSTTTQTFQQIINDLDTCVKYLPAKWPQNADYGRITKGAAAAFLGRVLVTWASPQWNPNSDQSRWQAAYDANSQAVSILSNNGFGLYKTWDYTMWTLEGSAGGSTPQNPEAVLVTEYNTSNDANGQNNNTYPTQTMPKSTGASGGSNQPTWELAQAFPMLDGKAPGSSSKYSYNVQTFYKNRDPRFNQTIAYNGCNWPLLGNANYRLWTYFYYTNAVGATASTKSTETSASNTGLYLRKGIDPSLTLATLPYAGTDWIEIRYAEVLLNLAESAAVLGKSTDVYTNLTALRKRAGIEAGTDGLYGLTANMSSTQMVNAVMYERQIELAFEGKRYWDLRRRKLLDATLNGKRRNAVVVLLNQTGTKTDYISGTRDASANTSIDNLYSTSFTVTTKVLDTYDINYQTTYYYFGIPTASLNNNANLQQTQGWGGSFNPLL
ncbi:RagB/SusD family nutrient uptake outer membrane protein [Mucilaginibacter robiniae]|uniref:RagB/SusD family nutrient uptake outer membrane protein n=1 Tax=Mucilaginibacter robiniae TaxID=2728022 RepID=A0A7L5EA76_9SPHI|nr:RagB/SusD family nutrient uptake outer membrane protein [Mucilaginibacter robiniae]QJD97286.1 RagB/SusD family nutrient uptake outer membrane protein [Mucilaginibacter robiniae]